MPRESVRVSGDGRCLVVGPRRGRPLWLTGLALPALRFGVVSLQARAEGDIIVVFSDTCDGIGEDDRNEVEESSRRASYELVFNSHSKSRIALRRRGVTVCTVKIGPGANTKHMSNPNRSEMDLASFRFQRYWFAIVGPVLAMGTGDAGQNECLRWEETSDIPGVKYVGVSSWAIPVVYREILVLNPQEDSFAPFDAIQVRCFARINLACPGSCVEQVQIASSSGAIQIPRAFAALWTDGSWTDLPSIQLDTSHHALCCLYRILDGSWKSCTIAAREFFNILSVAQTLEMELIVKHLSDIAAQFDGDQSFTCIPLVEIAPEIRRVYLQGRLLRLFESQRHSDLSLKCGAFGPLIPCHRFILASKNEKFRNMLRHPWIEAIRDVVEVLQVDPEILRGLLRCLYAGDTSPIEVSLSDIWSLQDKIDAIRGADELSIYFVIPSIVHSIKFTMRSCMDFHTWLDIADFSRMYNLSELFVHALDWITGMEELHNDEMTISDRYDDNRRVFLEWAYAIAKGSHWMMPPGLSGFSPSSSIECQMFGQPLPLPFDVGVAPQHTYSTKFRDDDGWLIGQQIAMFEDLVFIFGRRSGDNVRELCIPLVEGEEERGVFFVLGALSTSTGRWLNPVIQGQVSIEFLAPRQGNALRASRLVDRLRIPVRGFVNATDFTIDFGEGILVSCTDYVIGSCSWKSDCARSWILEAYDNTTKDQWHELHRVDMGTAASGSQYSPFSLPSNRRTSSYYRWFRFRRLRETDCSLGFCVLEMYGALKFSSKNSDHTSLLSSSSSR